VTTPQRLHFPRKEVFKPVFPEDFSKKKGYGYAGEKGVGG
jgi:hypothetical protein